MSDNKQKDKEIIDFLTASGYDEDIIKKALSLTESRDLDDIVDVIMDIENNKSTCKVEQVTKEMPKIQNEDFTKVLEQNKKAILVDRMYREELIRRYQEEKKRREEEEQIPEEKVAEIKGDCVFNVRFPDSKSIKLCFMKGDTHNDLFNKIAEIYGSSNFSLYKMRDSEAIKKSSEKLENNKKIYPKAALYIE
ncbi:UBX domain-containing protein [Vairimorpha necatrix]|uniref:UBX domain-containing protein n=1 Tax=Vairimorpha necatrix TaxID=6039 RepID=A0AAX4JD85_9MICR